MASKKITQKISQVKSEISTISKGVSKKTKIIGVLSLVVVALLIFLTYKFIVSGETDYDNAFFGSPEKRIWLVGICFVVIFRSLAYALGAWAFLRKHAIDGKLAWYKFIPLALQMTFIQVVTPFTFGSQPWAIFYLKRKGFNLREVIPAIMARDTIYQIALVIVPIAMSPDALSNQFTKLGFDDFFVTLLVIGLIVDFIIGIFILLAGVSTKFQRFCVRTVHWIGTKIFRKRNQPKIDEWFKKQEAFRENYINNLKDSKNVVLVCFLMMSYIISIGLLFYFSSEYANKDSYNAYYSIGTSIAAYSANGMIPLPGGLGTQEILLSSGTKIAFYKDGAVDSLAQNNTIGSWRFWSSFIPGGIGLLFLIFGIPSIIFKNKKWKNHIKLENNVK